MAEPKKETVRIVLPARRDGTPVASSPRETAMINLPPKPVPVPSGTPTAAPVSLKPPAPSVIASPAIPRPPSMPSIPKPPSMPSIPKPPSSGGVGIPTPVAPPTSIPRPPSMSPTVPPTVPPSAPPVSAAPSAAPKPPSVPPAASIAPTAPKPPSVGGIPPKPVAPAPLQAEAKKETAKVPASTPGSRVMPQATVQLQKKPDASKSIATTSISVVPGSAEPSSDLSPVLGIAALIVAVLSLGMQLWMMLA